MDGTIPADSQRTSHGRGKAKQRTVGNNTFQDWTRVFDWLKETILGGRVSFASYGGFSCHVSLLKPFAHRLCSMHGMFSEIHDNYMCFFLKKKKIFFGVSMLNTLKYKGTERTGQSTTHWRRAFMGSTYSMKTKTPQKRPVHVEVSQNFEPNPIHSLSSDDHSCCRKMGNKYIYILYIYAPLP